MFSPTLGPRPVGCFSALLARTRMTQEMEHLAGALKNSQFTWGEAEGIQESVH